MIQKNQGKTLFEIASHQQGYFTAKQAIKTGYVVNNHAYHVRNGDWIREWRGIYRLQNYPISELGQYSLWTLWSMDRKGMPHGVFSHETALSFFELSDIMPSKLHMTVPKKFRRQSNTPDVLVLHYDVLDSTEIEMADGFRITKPFRACVDLLVAGTVSIEIIREALLQGKQKGYITKNEVDDYLRRTGISERIKMVLQGVF